VLLERMNGGQQADALRSLLEQHVAATGSAHAHSILNQWPFEMENFWNVIPRAALSMQKANEAEAEAASAGETRGVAD
jgi:glutamate synthase domain-containing protein 3